MKAARMYKQGIWGGGGGGTLPLARAEPPLFNNLAIYTVVDPPSLRRSPSSQFSTTAFTTLRMKSYFHSFAYVRQTEILTFWKVNANCYTAGYKSYVGDWE